ncbi:MAG: DUF748 domain-containing protein [Bacteroidales bacterium]|jgi:hypothetical protein|nr:DUF748 domain-containing protein [Bacteroidales bacterium]
MKKPVKVIFIVFGVLFLLIIIISLFISPVAKHYIEKNSKDIVGRTVTMDKFRFNLFSGSLKVVGFDMKEQDGQESFFRFDTLSVRVKLFDFLRHKVTVQKIYLSDLHLTVWQKGNEFNFNDIIRKFGSTDTVAEAPRKPSKPWETGIYNIQLRAGNIFYRDLKLGSKWDMTDLNLKIPGVYFSGQETDIGFNLLFADGGKLGSSLQYNIETSAFRIQLDLENFSIRDMLPYLQQNMRLGTLAGSLDAHIHINGDTQHIMNSVIQGKAALRNLDMRDDRQQPALAADSLSMDIKAISLSESTYLLNEFSARGVATMYVMEKDSSSNFTYLLKKSAAPSGTATAKGQSQSAPVHLAIGNVDLRGIHVKFKDNTLQVPFTYEMKDIAIAAKNFDPDRGNDISIKGKLGNTGMADIRWIGNFNDLSNLNLKADFNSVEIKDFTPYSLEYCAYPITAGILTFTSQNTITANMLKGVNDVDIFKCSVDKVNRDVKPVMKVPLKLAVYVLKDRNDKISIDLPVEGDIRSPKFSYKKIIIKTLTNLLVKVSLTPLDFLAGSTGLKSDRLDAIEFTTLQEDFTSAQYDRFSRLASVIQAKPDLVLGISQDINYTQAIKDQSLASLKTDYYIMTKAPGKSADSLDMLSRAAIAQIRDNDPALLQYADMRPDAPVGGDIYTKAMALYRDKVNEQIGKLAEKRNQLLVDYMQAPAASIKVETVALVPGKTYEGKSVFKTSLTLPGEEPMTAPADNDSADDADNR